MPALIICSVCDRKLKVPEEVLGTTVKCPLCAGRFVAEEFHATPAHEPTPTRPATAHPNTSIPVVQPVQDGGASVDGALAPRPMKAGRPMGVQRVHREEDEQDTGDRPRREGRLAKRTKSRAGLWVALLVGGLLFVGLAGAGAIAGLIYWRMNKGIDAAAWKDFSPPDGRCHVLMPGAPKDEPLPQNVMMMPGVANLQPKKYHLDLLKTDRIGFALLTMNLPDEADMQGAFQLGYNAEREGALGNVTGGRLTAEAELTLDGYPVKEFQVTATDGGMVIERMYLVRKPPRRIYVLAAYGPKAKPNSPDVVKFFGSFKIEGDAQPANPNRNPKPEPDPTPQPVDKAKGITAGPKIEEFITAAVSPEGKTAFVLPNNTFLKTYSYPEFNLTASYPIGGVGYKSALDLKSGVLYLAVSDPKAIQSPHSNHNTLGTGDIHVYNVQPILEGTAEPGKKLEPTAIIKLDATVASLLLSPDGKWLYYLNVKDPKNIQAGRIDTATREKSPTISLAERTEKMVLSRDGKMLYSASRTGKENEGRIYAIDPAAWKITKDFIAELDPGDFDATDSGLLFVVNASGGWTNLHVVDVPRGLVAARWRIVVDGQRIQFSPDQKRYYLSKPGGSPQDVVARLVPEKLAPDAKPVDVGVWTAPGVVGRDYHVSPDGKFLLTRPGQVLRLSP
jgi:hypothetical protein